MFLWASQILHGTTLLFLPYHASLEQQEHFVHWQHPWYSTAIKESLSSVKYVVSSKGSLDVPDKDEYIFPERR